MTRPSLRGGRRRASSAVLVLHGGREHGFAPTHPLQLSHLRMVDLAAGLRARSRDCAVYVLRFRVRGWNPGLAEASPVTDARWALQRVRALHPGAPIVILGHSMGGRTAMAVADAPNVVGVCALAPWLPTGEPLPPVCDGQRFVLAHGTDDQMTSAPLSLAYAARLRDRGQAVAYYAQDGGGHALVKQPLLWHRFAVRTSLGLVGDRPLPSGVHRDLANQGAFTANGLEEFDR